jgi:hypothetical protein
MQGLGNMDSRIISELTALQRGVLAFYLDTAGGAVTGVQLFHAGYWGTLGERTVSRAKHAVAHLQVALKDGAFLHFYGSLGDSSTEAGHHASHEHQFVVVVDSETEDAVHLVAYARVYDEFVARLDTHHSFPLDEQNALRARGYTSILVTRADLHAPFQGKSDAVIAGKPMRILALVPLEPEEMQLKMGRGADAVFQRFAETSRDLLRLNPPRRP